MNTYTTKDIINLAKEYSVDQYDILECFLCELLNMTNEELYQTLEQEQ